MIVQTHALGTILLTNYFCVRLVVCVSVCLFCSLACICACVCRQESVQTVTAPFPTQAANMEGPRGRRRTQDDMSQGHPNGHPRGRAATGAKARIPPVGEWAPGGRPQGRDPSTQQRVLNPPKTLPRRRQEDTSTRHRHGAASFGEYKIHDKNKLTGER